MKVLIYKALNSNKNSTEILKICGNWFNPGGVNQIRRTYKVSKIAIFKTSYSLMYSYCTAYFTISSANFYVSGLS